MYDCSDLLDFVVPSTFATTVPRVLKTRGSIRRVFVRQGRIYHGTEELGKEDVLAVYPSKWSALEGTSPSVLTHPNNSQYRHTQTLDLIRHPTMGRWLPSTDCPTGRSVRFSVGRSTSCRQDQRSTECLTYSGVAYNSPASAPRSARLPSRHIACGTPFSSTTD